MSQACKDMSELNMDETGRHPERVLLVSPLGVWKTSVQTSEKMAEGKFGTGETKYFFSTKSASSTFTEINFARV